MIPPTPVTIEPVQAADDEALVAAFLEGRREAFDDIVERHWRRVYHLCYRFVGNHEDASELAQDVFVRAFKGLRKFKGDSALGTWLHRVGVNVCLSRVAIKAPPCRSIGVMDRRDDRIEDPLAQLVRGERAATVRAAILKLPPKQRATLLLRVYRDLPHEEIARILGRSVGTGKANFFNALGSLRRLLESA
ncbi:MAG TPA: sigma-70 family RNA polymerase sigma factor [Vicinamibacterales bacterium]|nr:sigma-70 family RNA polymerase sigma factor [Vicinamibacterales bacterium]